VRRAGFAARLEFPKFLERFKLCSAKTYPAPWTGTDRGTVMRTAIHPPPFSHHSAFILQPFPHSFRSHFHIHFAAILQPFLLSFRIHSAFILQLFSQQFLAIFAILPFHGQNIVTLRI
jgi:hypothetical protein